MNLEALSREFETNKERVIDMLVDNCMKVDIDIPRVVKGDFEANQWSYKYIYFHNLYKN